MRHRTLAFVALTASLMVTAVPASAHHSFTAEFDGQKMVTVSGVLTRVDWVNPHTYYYIDGKDDAGNSVTWEIESMPPGMLHKAGVSKEMFTIGQMVTVDAWGAKDGSKHLVFAKTFRFADGHVIKTMNDDIKAPPDK